MPRISSTFARSSSLDYSQMALTIALVTGLLVRLAILWQTPDLGTRIVDEQHYRQIAQNIGSGNGFAWGPGAPTSIRPPLYPAMLAAIWAVAGSDDLQAVRIVQIVLGLGTAGLVYAIGARIYGPKVGRWAAAVCWLYPSFIFFNFLILTETLFTFLLVAFLLFTVGLVQHPRAWTAVACGTTLGLAALTRSILWPMPIVLCPLLALLIRAPLPRRLALPCLVAAGYLLVVTPWAIRNTRLQGVPTVVDTMGGINLRMGNYEYTPDDRMWDAVALTGDKSWVHGIDKDLPGQHVTEGVKEKWAQRKAVEFMRAHPMVTLRRSVIKFADFWGLEREFMAGVQNGMYTPAPWFQILGSAAIVLAYVAVVMAGAAGIWLAAPEDRRMHIVLLLPVLIIMGAHTIVFGHSRYHLPLIPIFGVYAAALCTLEAPAYRFSHGVVRMGALVSVAALLAVWIRQVALVDMARISSLLNHAG
jgi:4-amino-4-deoxy-L-arabinose transferase-like glycosyltransferase